MDNILFTMIKNFKIKELLKKTELYNYLYFTIFSSISFFLNFGNNLLLSNILNETNYGRIRYIIDGLLLVQVYLSFGFANSLSRLIVCYEDIKSELIGVCTIIYLIISSFFTLVIIFIPNILYETKIVCILCFIPISQLIINYVLIGEGRSKILALFNCLPNFLFFLFLVLITISINKADFRIILVPYLFINTAISIFRITKIKMNFKNIKKNIKILLNENKHNGLKIYFGSLFGVGISLLIPMLYVSILSLEEYGKYSLAVSLMSPLITLISSISIVLFRKNVNKLKMTYQLMVSVFVMAILVDVGFFITFNYIFIDFFPKVYVNSLTYINYMILYAFFMGIGDFFNRFIGAKGKGNYLMVGAIITGVVFLSVSYFTVNSIGIYGFVIARIVSALSYFCCMIFAYNRVTKVAINI